MRNRLGKLWEDVNSSYWFVPALMSGSAFLLVIAMLYLDTLVSPGPEPAWLYIGSADAARTILGTVAGSMINVTGITFSITFVVLTIASSQYGSRVLQTFMHDRSVQMVLGAFSATFVYSILAMRQIRGGEDNGFVPHITVTVGIALAVFSVGVLIYFINHTARSIQAFTVVANIGRDLLHVVERMFPQPYSEAGLHSGDGGDPSVQYDHPASPLTAGHAGYIQSVDEDHLVKAAVEHDVTLRMASRPGDFVRSGSVLVWVSPDVHIEDELAKAVRRAFVIAARRTVLQDVEFVTEQLVEMALRALSPTLNDPFTAMSCIDWLGAGLCSLAGREPASPYRFDEENQLRLIALPVTFEEVVQAGLADLVRVTEDHPRVRDHLMDTIAAIDHCTRSPERKALLNRMVADPYTGPGSSRRRPEGAPPRVGSMQEARTRTEEGAPA